MARRLCRWLAARPWAMGVGRARPWVVHGQAELVPLRRLVHACGGRGSFSWQGRGASISGRMVVGCIPYQVCDGELEVLVLLFHAAIEKTTLIPSLAHILPCQQQQVLV